MNTNTHHDIFSPGMCIEPGGSNSPVHYCYIQPKGSSLAVPYLVRWILSSSPLVPNLCGLVAWLWGGQGNQTMQAAGWHASVQLELCKQVNAQAHARTAQLAQVELRMHT